MSNKYAVIVNSVVVNILLWDGESEWTPPEGFAVPAPDYVGINWRYEDGNFIDPNTPPAPTNGEILNQKMTELAGQLKIDVERINQAYLSAIVVDGASEHGKVLKIRQELAEKKQQYKDDLAALILEYGE